MKVSLVHLEGTGELVPPVLGLRRGRADDTGNHTVVLGGDGRTVLVSVGGLNVAQPPRVGIAFLDHLQSGRHLEYVAGDKAAVMDVLVYSPIIVVATRHLEGVTIGAVSLCDGKRSAMISCFLPESEVSLLKVGVLNDVVRAVEVVRGNCHVVDRHVKIRVGIFGVEVQLVGIDHV